MKWKEALTFAENHNFIGANPLTDADLVNILCWYRNVLCETIEQAEIELSELLLIASVRGVQFASCGHAINKSEDSTQKCKACRELDELLGRS